MVYLNRDRIQNRLTELGQEGAFFAITYDSKNDRAYINTATHVEPSSVAANEVAAEFDEARVNRRTLRRERISWMWELRLQFPVEVTLEAFENSLLTEPPVLLRENGLEQVTLQLRDVDYNHPPRQGSSSGTQATLVFEAHLSSA